MKNGIIILIVLAALFVLWLLFRDKLPSVFGGINAIMVPAGELDLDNPPASITFNEKVYKYSHPEGKFESSGKEYPMYFVFANSPIKYSSKVYLGIPRTDVKPECVINEQFTWGDNKYWFYKNDEKMCLYERIIIPNE